MYMKYFISSFRNKYPTRWLIG